MNDLVEATPTVAAPSLPEAVQRTFYDYLSKLEGETPSDLHKLFLTQFDIALFSTIMRYTRYNQVRAAKILGISRTTLRQKLKTYRLT